MALAENALETAPNQAVIDFLTNSVNEANEKIEAREAELIGTTKADLDEATAALERGT